jgi:hypothetical protein
MVRLELRRSYEGTRCNVGPPRVAARHATTNALGLDCSGTHIGWLSGEDAFQHATATIVSPRLKIGRAPRALSDRCES